MQELLSLRKEYTQREYTSGRAQISANYTQSVLPGNKGPLKSKMLYDYEHGIEKKYVFLKYILTCDYQLHDLHLNLNFDNLENASF